MTETTKWIMTQDHRPTFEECEGKIVVFHLQNEPHNRLSALIFTGENKFRHYFEVYPRVDRYIFLDIDIPEFIPDPEPVPCKVCGGKATVTTLLDDADVFCKDMHHNIEFYAPTRAEAIQLWNKWNGG